ncbi:hypothetical protein U0358_12015 [Idiomarina sp. PL1-037]|uniref:hypothetical protein n=1 Tax=Idiomarina sp. PL1-037 TaxID=3095365 RepID=UPI002ACC34D4|nr:hypothetical protein [Idiomarina sp. PL1-037]WQC52744.1 hypothetical protein U0358_12015 [Idiomarina sp. PL1-037]
MKKHVIAVITGDIVDSRSLSSARYDELLKQLKNELKSFEASDKATFDIYRGDSFQITFFCPWAALKAAILIRLKLKSNIYKIDVRQSISIGNVKDLREDVKTSIGQAFILSGKHLDEMKSHRLVFSSENKLLNRHIPIVVKLLDTHISSLTSMQSQALYSYLLDDSQTHAELANKLNKSRANTTKILNGSEYRLVADSIHYFETLVHDELNHD